MGRKITALRAQKRNPRRVNVFLDGEFAFGLERIVAAWLQMGQELSEEKIASLQAEDQYEAAYQKALNFLQYRERSEAEVLLHLKDRNLPEQVAGKIMERLRQNGLVKDPRFAQAWVENRTEFHPRSRRALAYELRQKGVDREVIEQAIETVDDESMAYQAASKQVRKYQHLEWPEFRQKMLGFLARRGFNYEIAAPVVARVWTEHRGKNSAGDDSSDEHSWDEEVSL